MRFKSLLAVVALLFFAVPSSLPAQDRGEDQNQEQNGGILSLLPADAVTRHVLKLPSGELAYTATAGTLDLRDQDGKTNAKVFYTAYVAEGASVDRPITFAFNGGPGAASAYLHLGLVGPRIVEFDARNRNGTQPRLVDNPDSWLAFTDLVLIDPVGTGWSRAAGKDAESAYCGVRQDAQSLAKAIALYIQRNGRVGSPKYLLGESYGGLRAVKVATALKDEQGIVVSGIVMVSPLIDGRLVLGSSDDPLGAAVQFPSLVAAELERKATFSEQAVAEAEKFAMGDYLVSLAGPAPMGETGDRLYARIAQMTGIKQEAVARARGFVGDIYTKNLAAAEGKFVSPYDAAVLMDDPYPETADDRGADPILDGYTRAYGAAFASYAHDELRFSTELSYRLLNKDVNRRWDWDGTRSDVSAVRDLRDLLSVVPSFRLLVAHGYSDTLTPYGASRYVIDHLPPSLTSGRADLQVYRGGHMFYTEPDERQKFTADVRNFYAGSDKD
ncbi:carboxypeptidase C (cathepsin A) [Mycoplana sp. BE70]|uniref:S10 family peptidase n=1 Tax=Mycoplana sp. BE70 TaxID=2817775 RepID=UPI00285FBB59|nr:carboxypeptidase [Mycoplana sp. BE70]MDR6756872.1 carboxypeptidase C (cathepsin A) [Mycoplana sp. BE70]